MANLSASLTCDLFFNLTALPNTAPQRRINREVMSCAKESFLNSQVSNLRDLDISENGISELEVGATELLHAELDVRLLRTWQRSSPEHNCKRFASIEILWETQAGLMHTGYDWDFTFPRSVRAGRCATIQSLPLSLRAKRTRTGPSTVMWTCLDAGIPQC